MKCPVCGRFMREGGYYSNDHLDSWESTYKCVRDHKEKALYAPLADT